VFTLTATTPLGCQGSETMAINLLSVNFMNLNGDRSLCPNIPTTLTAGGALNYLWSPAYLVSDSTASTVTVSPSTTTTFYVYGTDNKGCKDTLQATVVINPSAVINLGPSQTIYPGQSAQLYANGNCSYFTFTPPFGLSATNIKDPVAQPAVTTRYYVTGITEEGCAVSDSIDIIVSPESYIEMANAFSPGSGTSINDEYRIILKGQATLNTFKIFNRWGELVFSTTDINKGWNGQYKNKPQPMGSYIYVVEAVTPTGKRFNKQGNVTLIR
jgi:gliding motility-associated-like protein